MICECMKYYVLVGIRMYAIHSHTYVRIYVYVVQSCEAGEPLKN